MDLKTRRNLPLVILFVTIVAILVFGLGNQPIIAYTIDPDLNNSQADVAEAVYDPGEPQAGFTINLNTNVNKEIEPQ